MSKCIMLIGLPGSGKSYWSKKYIQENPDTILVSSDSIREKVFGDVNDQSHNGEVFNIVHQRVVAAIKNGRDVILDATNLSRKRRVGFLKSIPDCLAEAIVFAIPFEFCCKRNAARDRVVPQEVMDRMYRSFQPPHYAEGFDKIKYITSDSKKVSLEDILNKNKISHDNPHHTLDIYSHCIATEKIARKISIRENLSNKDSILLQTAARYHDIGKFICKTFSDYKGNLTEIAHYFSHQNVSAYLFLCYDTDLEDKKKTFISNLIYHHMDFYMKDFKSKKMFFNENFIKLLKLLNESDRAAH